MLEVPTEIAAIVTTKMIIITIEGLGHTRCGPSARCYWIFPDFRTASGRARPTCSASLTGVDRLKMPGLTCSGPQIGSAYRRTNSGGASG